MSFLRDKKNLVILLLAILFIIKIPREGFRFASWVMIGVFICTITDFLINKLYFKRTVFPNSAIISGFIVSGILDYRQGWLVLVIFSLLPVISKAVIKYGNRHIFNPANFSLFLATLFKFPLTWKIEANIYLIITFGIYFAYTYKKLFHIFGFLVTFVALSLIQGVQPFGLLSLFFIFVMLIEPKTSGHGPGRVCLWSYCRYKLILLL